MSFKQTYFNFVFAFLKVMLSLMLVFIFVWTGLLLADLLLGLGWGYSWDQIWAVPVMLVALYFAHRFFGFIERLLGEIFSPSK